MHRLGFLALFASLGLWAQEEALVREGNYWTRVVSGSAAIAGASGLQVVARGGLSVHGAAVDQVSFRLKQRVRARSETEARLLMGGVASGRVPGNLVRVTIVAAAPVSNEFELTVPRQMPSLLLDSRGGEIEVLDFDGSVNAATVSGPIRMDRIGGAAQSRTGGGDIRLGRIGGSVRCGTGGGSVFLESSGGETNCTTAGGEISVREAGGPVMLSTMGGNIRVEKAAGPVEAHSGGGVIDVGQVRGIVVADTRGGSIQIASARGVRAESALGAVRVKSYAGPMNVAAAAGSILAELLAGGRIENSSLVATSGDITVLIPSNFAVSVMARNESGAAPRIISDFPEVRVRMVGLLQPPLVAEGAINGGGPVLNINVSSGVIYLRRLK